MHPDSRCSLGLWCLLAHPPTIPHWPSTFQSIDSPVKPEHCYIGFFFLFLCVFIYFYSANQNKTTEKKTTTTTTTTKANTSMLEKRRRIVGKGAKQWITANRIAKN